MKDGDNVLYAGLVICRQRCGTAGGVVFMTLEDETGFVNVVVWESVFQRYSVLAKTVSFLGITGKLQVEDSVVPSRCRKTLGAESGTETEWRRQQGFSLRALFLKESTETPLDR
jgi:DNA polymerase III alpha subunit